MSRLPLRWQLLIVLLLLLALGLVGSAVIVPAALENYLVSKLDARITRTAQVTFRPGGRPWRVSPGHQFIPSDTVIQFRDENGTEVAPPLRAPNGEAGQPHLPSLREVPRNQPFTVRDRGVGHDWRVVVRADRDRETYVIYATSLAEIQRTVGQSRRNILLVGVGALVILVGLGYFLVRRSFRPLEQVERTAEEIAALDLSSRVPITHPNSEVGRLGTALNTMLGHIESAFRDREASEAAARRSEDRMRRFVADASHELRSPLTSIRGYAELYRQGAVTEDELPATMSRIEDEAARMGLLVDDLLLLARLDQQRPLRRGPVDLVAVTVDCVRDARAVAGGRTIDLDIRAAALTVLGDEPRLRQVVSNLLNNAVTHTPETTTVTVTLAVRDTLPDDIDSGTVPTAAVLTVADNGPGFTAEERERAFERFFRASESRSRDSGGTGLGLAIVAALIAAHQGTVDLRSEPGESTVFTITLPLASQDPALVKDRESIPDPATVVSIRPGDDASD